MSTKTKYLVAHVPPFLAPEDSKRPEKQHAKLSPSSSKYIVAHVPPFLAPEDAKRPEKQHAKLSPSSSSRWLRCARSLAYPAEDEFSSPAAAEGTAAHALAETMLVYGLDPTDALRWWVLKGSDIGIVAGHPVTTEMCEYVTVYVGYVRRIAQELTGWVQPRRKPCDGIVFHVEHRLDLSLVTGEPGAGGTADAIIMVPGEVHIIDLKYGRGVVSATNNPQLLMYAAAAARNFNLPLNTSVHVHIVQPRVSSVPSVYHTTVSELTEWHRSVVVPAVALGRRVLRGDSGVDYVPGEHQCRFCPGRTKCPAVYNKVKEALGKSKAAVEEKFEGIDDGKLAEMYGLMKLAKTMLDAVKAEVEKRFAEGKRVPGLKQVSGRRRLRKWGDEKGLRDFALAHDLVSILYHEAVISPAQAATALKKAGMSLDDLSAFIVGGEATKEIVPVDDPRDEVK